MHRSSFMVGGLLALTFALVPGARPALAQGSASEDTVQVQRRPEIPRGVYDKPFLKRFGRGVSVAGYIDMDLLADENGSTFDQHRFIPFLYGQVSDRVSVSSEIEFEHGGFVSGDDDSPGEVKLEFAQLDFSAAEWLNFRGGVVLAPLGRFNLTHDSPAYDLTDRPLVDRNIIPTTLSEAGMGIFGMGYPSESAVLSYEAYLVNGFNEDILQRSGDTVTGLRVRSGRSLGGTDNNNNRALTARVGLSPRLGMDLGASIHTGRYTDRDHSSESLTIAALDAFYSLGPLELLGEFAMAGADIPEEHEGPESIDQNGWFVQMNYHFLAGAVSSLPNSIFTGIVRFDQVDFDTDNDGLRDRRLNVGVNFRPTEDTAIKFDVNRTWRAPSGSDQDGEGFDALRFSLASYF